MRNHDAGARISQLRRFSGSNFRGVVGAVSDTSLMPEDDEMTYLERPVAYTVLSYGIPIAWLTDAGNWVHTEHSYGRTSDVHRSIARKATAHD